MCHFVNTIALEPFEISWNFYGCNIWSKAQTSLNVAAFRCTVFTKDVWGWCWFICDVSDYYNYYIFCASDLDFGPKLLGMICEPLPLYYECLWQLLWAFLPRDAMHKRRLCCHAVSVRPSVTFMDHVKMNKHIFEIFSPLGSDTILVFPYQRGCWYSDGNPPNGGVECKRVW